MGKQDARRTPINVKCSRGSHPVRVAVIGGGVSGLAAAWLLQDDHDVTLIEKEPRLGGHANTIEVSHRGKHIRVESGFEFFSEEIYPAFGRLLRALRVPLRRYPMTYTLYFEDSSKVHVLPPKRP